MQFFLHILVFKDCILQYDDRPAEHMTKNQSLTNMDNEFLVMLYDCNCKHCLLTVRADVVSGYSYQCTVIESSAFAGSGRHDI